MNTTTQYVFLWYLFFEDLVRGLYSNILSEAYSIHTNENSNFRNFFLERTATVASIYWYFTKYQTQVYEPSNVLFHSVITTRERSYLFSIFLEVENAISEVR